MKKPQSLTTALAMLLLSLLALAAVVAVAQETAEAPAIQRDLGIGDALTGKKSGDVGFSLGGEGSRGKKHDDFICRNDKPRAFVDKGMIHRMIC